MSILSDCNSQFIEMFGDPVANPMSWDVCPLLSLGSCKNGMNYTAKECGEEIKCLGVADFQERARIDSTTELSTISLNSRPPEEYLLKDDDIVFVRSNGNKDLVGRSVLVRVGSESVTFSGFCIRFRQEADFVSPLYLLYLFKSESVKIKLRGRGANVQNLNQKILSSIAVPLPPRQLQIQFDLFVKQIDKSKFAVHSGSNLNLSLSLVTRTTKTHNAQNILCRS